jgi:hypothetical protein
VSVDSAEGRTENGQARWSRRRPKQAAAVYVAAYIALAAVGGWLVAALGAALAPYLAEPVSAAAVLGLGLVVTVIAAVVLALSLLLVLSICRISTDASKEVIAILCLSVLFPLTRPSVFAFLGRWIGLPEAGARLAEALSVLPGQLLIGNTVLIVWAAFLGKLVSRIIKEGKLLVPVAVVAAVADVITVFWGIVKHVSETAPEVAETFSAAAPVELPEGVYAPILAFVGIGDFLFLSLFFAVAIRYAMRPVKTLWASYVVMLVAPLGFWFVPGGPGLPGLPFIAAAALWANWRHIRFNPEEKRALAVAAALVAAVVAAVWVVFHR